MFIPNHTFLCVARIIFSRNWQTSLNAFNSLTVNEIPFQNIDKMAYFETETNYCWRHNETAT